MELKFVPVPVVKMPWDWTDRAFRKNFETCQAKGYCAVYRDGFIDSKLLVLNFDNCMILKNAVIKGNIHDIYHFTSMNHLPRGK
jgi:hypothetical protein